MTDPSNNHTTTAYDAEALLARPITSDYRPVSMFTSPWIHMHRMPYFTRAYVDLMKRDPRIRFGLWLLKGPILANARFRVGSSNPQVLRFVVDNLTWFWSRSASRALSAIEWGYHASEVIYRLDPSGQVAFKGLRWLHPRDCQIVTLDGEKVGILVSNTNAQQVTANTQLGRVYVGGPKSFWHVHGREENQWHGFSRLEGAFIPWMDAYGSGGSIDSLRLFFYKYAYRGARIYYPPGSSPDEYGRRISNKTTADKIANDVRAGGVITLPNERDTEGNQKWIFEDAENTASGQELMDYDDRNAKKMAEGMGIPVEVIEAFSSGSGYAGRRVPAEAFYSMLQEIANWLVTDVDEQILRALVCLNFGPEVDYEIKPLPLLSASERAEARAQEAQQEAQQQQQQQELMQQQLPPGGKGNGQGKTG